jgi:DNA-binding response OmpR family regulator
VSGRYPSTCLVLLVEDHSVVALALEDDLTNAGYTVAGPFSACSDALAWLSTRTPDLAVLDIMLRDGPCTDLAAELTRRDVPFVVYSASTRTGNTFREFMDATWVEKPGSGTMVLRALAAVQSDQIRREG